MVGGSGCWKLVEVGTGGANGVWEVAAGGGELNFILLVVEVLEGGGDSSGKWSVGFRDSGSGGCVGDGW